MKRLLPLFALFLALAVTTPAEAASTYAKTRYPIVLAHGMAGFRNIGPIDYWFNIPSDLTANGAKVYVTRVSSFQSSEYRGEQLLAQVQEILAISGAQKVNLIGHSHGNQSVRYVAGVLPERVASVTSVGGPTKGSPVVDLALAVMDLPLAGLPVTALVQTVGNAFGGIFGLAQGKLFDQDTVASLRSLSTRGAAAFNTKFPAGVPTTACGEGAYTANGVAFYSWSGTAQQTRLTDPIDYVLNLTAIAFIGNSDPKNDGLVGRCSSHLGKVIRDDYAMNHFDEINHIFGLTHLLETDPRAVFRSHANRLKNAGF